MNANQLIDFLGGTSVVARLCDITTGAVSQWRTNGIPKGWFRFLANEAEKKKRREAKKAA
jgi:hypothetical protein